jgi:hypothetical protein
MAPLRWGQTTLTCEKLTLSSQRKQHCNASGPVESQALVVSSHSKILNFCKFFQTHSWSCWFVSRTVGSQNDYFTTRFPYDIPNLRVALTHIAELWSFHIFWGSIELLVRGKKHALPKCTCVSLFFLLKTKYQPYRAVWSECIHFRYIYCIQYTSSFFFFSKL